MKLTTLLFSFFLTNLSLILCQQDSLLTDSIRVAQSETPPLAKFSSDRRKACPNQLFYFYDESENNHDEWEWEFEGGIPSTSNEENPVVYFPEEGSYRVALTVFNEFGSNKIIRNQYINAYYPIGESLDFSEKFESFDYIEKWSVDPVANQWEIKSVLGSTEESQYCMSVNNYSINANGEKTTLISPPLDFSDTEGTQLYFDIAYANYPNYFDTLSIYFSDNCGENKQLLWRKGGVDLSTSMETTEPFYPVLEDWVTVNIDLSDLSENQNKSIFLYFENEGHWGNNLYLDNIFIHDPLSVISQESANIRIYPNPTQDLIKIDNINFGSSYKIFNATGQLILEGTYTKAIDVSDWTNGIYYLSIEFNNQWQNIKFLKE